jgi:hypothetical protein
MAILRPSPGYTRATVHPPYPMDFHQQVANSLLQTLSQEQLKNDQKLYRSLRLLAKYRSQLIANTLVAQNGLQVRKGPFQGMTMPPQVAEGCFVPKLLGCYEQELHPYCHRAAEQPYDIVLNIGCAEGYYAIGLARLLPQATIWAYDTNPNAQKVCAQLAELNGVRDRLQIGGHFRLEDFEQLADRRVLLVCDIEGAEMELLQPSLAPALKGFDILLEMHDVYQHNVSQAMQERFGPSHHIELVGTGSRNPGDYPELQNFENLDQLLAVWEWRLGPTPWAFMTAKGS